MMQSIEFAEEEMSTHLRFLLESGKKSEQCTLADMSGLAAATCVLSIWVANGFQVSGLEAVQSAL